MGSPSIWPGPECLDDTPLSVRWAVAFDAGDWDECNRIVIARDESHRRSLGIAMALEAARARMRRFVAWLEESEEAGAFDDVLAHVSPEAAVHYAASKGYQWPFYTTGGDWLDRWWDAFGRTAEMALVPEMLASPEWASLPWQRDPEVRRGS